MKVNKAIFSYVAKTIPVETRLRAARGEARELNATELLTTLYILLMDEDHRVREGAVGTLETLTEEVLLDAICEILDPKVIHTIAFMRQATDEVLKKLIACPHIEADTIISIAKSAPLSVAEALQNDREKLTTISGLAEALQGNLNLNPPTPEPEPIPEPEPEPEPTPEPEPEPEPEEEVITPAHPQEEVPIEHKNLVQRIAAMSVSEKIKFGITGDKEARNALIKESNKLITGAVLKNPRITDNEIIQLTATKGTSEDILRTISRSRDWLKNYTIKYNLITNPKTPVAASMNLLRQLHKKDLINISKSKAIPSILAITAKKVLATFRG